MSEELIAEYREKIAALDKQLAEIRSDKLNNAKLTAMINAGYTVDQIDRYKSHITGESEAEIEESLAEFRQQIPPAHNPYVDPLTPMNGQRSRPLPTDDTEIGREMFKRLKEKGAIRSGLWPFRGGNIRWIR